MHFSIRLPQSRVLIGFALYAAGLVFAFAAMSSAAAGDNADAELSPSVPALPAQAPGTGRITGSMATARELHTATLLPNGQVLVAGGAGLTDYLASAELYDPATGMWMATGSMTTARARHTATLLPNGQVLVAGGESPFTCAELYDPATGIWTVTSSRGRCRLLADGHLAAGWAGAGGRRFRRVPRPRNSDGRTVRSGERDLDGHRTS